MHSVNRDLVTQAIGLAGCIAFRLEGKESLVRTKEGGYTYTYTTTGALIPKSEIPPDAYANITLGILHSAISAE